MSRTYPPHTPGMNPDGSYRLPKGNRWHCHACNRDVTKTVSTAEHYADYHTVAA